MKHSRTYTGMWLCSLTAEQRERTCSYWYTVTTFGCTPHTAFRTKAALLYWLQSRGLSVAEVIPEHGEHGCFRIVGEYREAMHLDHDAFRQLVGAKCREMSNGEYTLGVITADADGLKTVHTLNPNVKDRPTFHHAESRDLQDMGHAGTVSHA